MPNLVSRSAAKPAKGRAVPTAAPGVGAPQARRALAPGDLTGQPHSVTFLAGVFGLDPRTAKKRLASLRPVAEERGHPLYGFADAAGWLIEPKEDLADRLARMRPQDMPPLIQAIFWDGMLKRLAYMEKAGELWSSGAVLASMSGAFQELRENLLRLPDALHKELGLTDEQCDKAERAVESMLSILHAALVSKAAEDLTRAQVAEAEAMALEAAAAEALERGDPDENDDAED